MVTYKQATKESTYVIGTVRSPDGQLSAVIDGVVIDQGPPEGGWFILDKPTAEAWAKAGNLWVKNPEGEAVQVLSIDDRYIRTASDKTKLDNLKSLVIYDRVKKAWISGATGQPASAPVTPR